MDVDRFDDALRHFSKGRRPILGLGLTTLLAAVGVSPSDARKKRRKRKKKHNAKPECVVDADCSTGLRCNPDDGRCLCDAESNLGGCCSADRRTSFPGTSDSACGIIGNICLVCPPNTSCITGGTCI